MKKSRREEEEEQLGRRPTSQPFTPDRLPRRANVPCTRSRKRATLAMEFVPRPRFRPRMTTDKFSRLLSFWRSAVSSVALTRIRLCARAPQPPRARLSRSSPLFPLSRLVLAILSKQHGRLRTNLLDLNIVGGYSRTKTHITRCSI